MTGIDRLPTATATPARLRAFQATRRPQQLVKTIQTAFGNLTIEGRLGQVHADLMECVMFLSETSRVKDGRLEIVVDPHKIRCAMGDKGCKYSASTIKTLEKDLRKTLLDIETPHHKIMGGIVERIVESKLVRADRRGWSSSKNRNLQCWIFTLEWTALVQSDMPRFYNPTPLCRIKHGSVSAIARHVLTHQHQPRGGWKLVGLMAAAGVERQASKVWREVKESAGLLAEVGIRIEGDRVFLATPAPLLAAPAPFSNYFSHSGPIF